MGIEMREARERLERAYNLFNEATDSKVIDYAISEIQACEALIRVITAKAKK